MTLLLSAVMYSPNIGDGVIAECIRAAAAPTDVTMLDLAGRTSYATTGASGQQRLVAGIARLPAPLANRLSEQLVKAQIQRKLLPLLPEKLARADGILIGGGQLLADANMNFPLKLHRLVTEAGARPVGIHAVGVAARWSPRADALFRTVLDRPDLRFLSVRDAASKSNLEAHLHRIGLSRLDPPQVFPDPGVLSAPLLAPDLPAAPKPQLRHIGLGITHPAALALHGEETAPGDWPAWYARMAREAVAQGLRVTLFTNGAFEDEACRAKTAALLRDLGPEHLLQPPRPQRPAELVRLIAGCDAVISHRLHASIVAFSAAVPPIGLRWDRKLEGFFDLIGRPEALMPEIQPEPAEILARMPGQPLDMTRHAAVLEAARNGVAAAVAALGPVA